MTQLWPLLLSLALLSSPVAAAPPADAIPVAEQHRHDAPTPTPAATAAFANPSGGNYDAEAAKDAWEKTRAFLKKRLAA